MLQDSPRSSLSSSKLLQSFGSFVVDAMSPPLFFDECFAIAAARANALLPMLLLSTPLANQ
jgi:hypothetical protein